MLFIFLVKPGSVFKAFPFFFLMATEKDIIHRQVILIVLVFIKFPFGSLPPFYYIILGKIFFLLICYLWSSWRWMSKSLPRFGKFSAIISLKKLPLSHSLLLPELQECIDCFSWWYLIVYAGFLCSFFLPSFHPSFFLFFSDWIISKNLSFT